MSHHELDTPEQETAREATRRQEREQAMIDRFRGATFTLVTAPKNAFADHWLAKGRIQRDGFVAHGEATGRTWEEAITKVLAETDAAFRKLHVPPSVLRADDV